MAELIWSPAAAGDLEEICEHIEKDSEYYSRIFARQIVALIETIPDFPEAGKIVPEYQREDLRERLFQNYRIVYRLKPDSIEIAAIIHGARLLPEIQP